MSATSSSSPSAVPRTDAGRIVVAFLRALETRDLPAAAALLAPHARMTFPGGHTFERLEELLAWLRPRYRSVRKTFERFDEFDTGDDGRAIVYNVGRLHGEWPDGRPLAGVRYVDRFELVGGRIVDQQVWNDTAEVRAAAAASLDAPFDQP